MKRTIVLLLSEMRVKQWTKNLLVYAAPLFNGSLFHPVDFMLTSLTFFAFSMTASGIYIINDIHDFPKDRLNPRKKSRPIAAGSLAVSSALVCSAVCLLLGMGTALAVNTRCFGLLVSYVVVNILYTLRLKRAVIIDVMIIAYGFVVRAVAGAAASGVKMTSWFVLCVMFLSLFLALGKRRCELLELTESVIPEGREVLKHYSLELLDHMINVVTSALIMCYALFTADNREMFFTIPLVLYGVFYYLYVIHIKHGGGSPDEELYREKPILITAVIYILFIVFTRNL